MLTATTKQRENNAQILGCRQGGEEGAGGGPADCDESDEERELTNLNWLLRNQNLAWPKTIDAISEDDLNPQLAPSGNRSRSCDVSNLGAQKKQKLHEFGSAKNASSKYLNRNLVTFPDARKQGAAPLKRPSPAERYDIFINKIKRDLAEYEKSANKYKTDVTQKPPFNYSHIIGMAMLENGRVTLQQICAWIESKFAFFRVRKKWNNSIRHNLSLHHCFRNRKREEKGKGGYWELGVDPKKCDRKRIRNRKTSQAKLNKSQSLANETECSQSTSFGQNEDKNVQMCYSRLADEGLAGQDVQLEAAEQAPLTLTEVEVGLGLNMQDPEGNFLYSDSFATATEAFQQYELGTIIISTTGLIDEPSSCILSNKFNCANMIYAEDEIPLASEKVIIASHKMDSTRDANIALLAPPGSEIPSSLTINCDYANFRPYMDDEPFSYLHGSEISRSEDILDNLLDVCVRDY